MNPIQTAILFLREAPQQAATLASNYPDAWDRREFKRLLASCENAAAALERLVTDPPGEVVEQICRRNNEDWGDLQALDRIDERKKTRAVLRAAGEVDLP